VSWVVVAFHRPAALERALAAVGAHPELDVVVVNVEADAEVAAVARAAGARHVDVEGNPGFGPCVNLGAAEAAHAVVVFGNDDLTTTWDDLQRLVAPVAAGSCDVAVPGIRNGEGEVEPTIAALATPGTLALEWLALPDRPPRAIRWPRVQKWRRPTGPEDVDAATAALVAVRADLLVAEPMPEAYFLYWEEQEWFWRLAGRAARVSYRPEARVVHDGGRADVRPAKSRLLATNAVRCIRRTQGRRAAALALPVVVLWNVRLLVVDAARDRLGSGTRQRVAARRAGLAGALGAWRELR
jgi:GT2 family glycosyltransferase